MCITDSNISILGKRNHLKNYFLKWNVKFHIKEHLTFYVILFVAVFLLLHLCCKRPSRYSCFCGYAQTSRLSTVNGLWWGWHRIWTPTPSHMLSAPGPTIICDFPLMFACFQLWNKVLLLLLFFLACGLPVSTRQAHCASFQLTHYHHHSLLTCPLHLWAHSLTRMSPVKMNELQWKQRCQTGRLYLINNSWIWLQTAILT